jgi:hypothetical protein
MSTTAKTIISQIGNKALCMMGCKQIVTSENAVDLFIGIGAKCGGKAVNRIRIILQPNDTYTVEFCKYAKFTMTTIKSLDLVYADMLHQVIECNTGFYLSL